MEQARAAPLLSSWCLGAKWTEQSFLPYPPTLRLQTPVKGMVGDFAPLLQSILRLFQDVTEAVGQCPPPVPSTDLWKCGEHCPTSSLPSSWIRFGEKHTDIYSCTRNTLTWEIYHVDSRKVVFWKGIIPPGEIKRMCTLISCSTRRIILLGEM